MQESNKVKPDEFRVGDEVWCIMRGKGKVVMVLTEREQQHCPIVVDFEKTINQGTGKVYSNQYQYTKDGRWYQDFNRTLFFSEPKIEASVTRPFVPTLVGKTVIMEYFDGIRTDPVMITAESKDRVFYGSGSDYKSDLTAIYAVYFENLLK